MNESLKYLIKNDLEREKKELVMQEIFLIREYQCKTCQKCIGTEKQKKRDCGKLNGFLTLGCEQMSCTISKKMKQKNNKLLRKLISFELTESQKVV